jgi:hypothetical protein
MTIPEILEELEQHTGEFPMTAMQAAVEQREAITPELLRVLEPVAADPASWSKRTHSMLPLFALFLLAQFREKSAYPLLVKILSAPGEIPFDLFGDSVTENMSQILASVYDGDVAPLQRLVENESVNEYVRSAAVGAFLVMEQAGILPREAVVDYYGALFHGKLERTPHFVWGSLSGAVADLPAPELLPDVRQAYDEFLVDPTYATFKEIEQITAAPEPWRRERRHLITDAIAEMEWWDCFKRKKSSKSDAVTPKPYVPKPKIGRNDPCPCDSGKKYKKCCGK